MKLFVKKHPNNHTLAECVEAPDGAEAPSGYVSMTLSDFVVWRDAEVAGGWLPAAPVNTCEDCPNSVGPAQLRTALWKTQGISDLDVTNAISAIQDPEVMTRARILWEHATEFKRDNPLLVQLAGALGLSTDQVDSVFKEAQAY